MKDHRVSGLLQLPGDPYRPLLVGAVIDDEEILHRCLFKPTILALAPRNVTAGSSYRASPTKFGDWSENEEGRHGGLPLPENRMRTAEKGMKER